MKVLIYHSTGVSTTSKHNHTNNKAKSTSHVNHNRNYNGMFTKSRIGALQFKSHTHDLGNKWSFRACNEIPKMCTNLFIF